MPKRQRSIQWDSKVKHWKQLWAEDDPVKKIKARYQIGTEAVELITSGVDREVVTSKVHEALGGPSTSEANRILAIGENLDKSFVDYACEKAKPGVKGISYSHLTLIQVVSPKSEQRKLLERCLNEKLSYKSLKTLIHDEYEVEGGREEVRLTELAKKLTRSLKAANLAADKVLECDFVAAAPSVRPPQRATAIKELDTAIGLLDQFMADSSSLKSDLAAAKGELERLA